MTSVKKHQIREEILTFFDSYPNFALIKFSKTKHTTFEELRKLLKKSGAKIQVVKNSIFIKAFDQQSLKNEKIKEVREKAHPIKENTALLGLSEKWSDGLNTFYQFIQKGKTLSFKIAFLDQVIYLGDHLLEIAQIPNKEVLLGKIIGSFKSPISRLVYSLKYSSKKTLVKGVKVNDRC